MILHKPPFPRFGGPGEKSPGSLILECHMIGFLFFCGFMYLVLDFAFGEFD